MLRGLAVCLIIALFFVQDVSVFANNEISVPAIAPVLPTAEAMPCNTAAANLLLAKQAAAPNAAPPLLSTKAVSVIEAAAIPAQYRQVDAFANTTNHKGLQGMTSKEYGGQHTLLNLWIDSYVDDEDPGTFGYCWPYQYNGKTFYFDLSGIEMFMEIIRDLNRQNISVSMVFLLRYTEGREFLIDEAARVPGYKYYAPATTGDGGEAMKAFFEFFLWRCSAWGASVDNFILGNEINNPNAWHYSGTLNPATVAAKYAAAFCNMYNIVRTYTSISRCSISLDHNWTHTDEGREISGRSMLHYFNDALEALQPGVEWCIAYHLYPAIMYNTAIWRGSGYNTGSPNAMFVDGANLHVLTDYVRDTFGAQHRIMLTEQGFCLYNNNEAYQATALAITYYAAKYDPMVDCFILNCDSSEDPRLNFSIAGHLADVVYAMLDDGNPEAQAKIEQLILETSGRTVNELVPNYGIEPVKPSI